MNKRKYTVWGETPRGFKCTKEGCGWEGIPEELVSGPTLFGESDKCCPRCGYTVFKGLLNTPKI